MENKYEKLVISRLFDAPIERVWKAWSDPLEMTRWWGPKDFTAPEIRMDFRVGGEYLSCMKGPDGKKYWSTGVYKEIVPMKKIVVDDSFSDESGHRVPASYYDMSKDFPMTLNVTQTFEEMDGKTKFTLQHSGFPPGDDFEGAKVGWNQSLDKLAESLKS